MRTGPIHIHEPAASEVKQSRPFLFSVIAAGIAITCLLLLFYEGLRRGMDHLTMFGPENDQAAIAIAISDVVYGLNQGYVGHASVLQKLVEIWNQGAKSGHDPILIERGSNREVLNNAISAAASLGPQSVGFIGDRSLITMIYCDIGQVDLTKLAFRIFGLTIESRYYMFFLILSVSTLLFLLVFWNNLTALLVLLCTLFAFYIEVYTSVFTYNMPTFSAERYGSALALIPAWYFAFLIINRKRASFVTALCTLVQASIMLLAMMTRGAGMWAFLFVGLVSILAGANELRKQPRLSRTWLKLLRLSVAWPSVLLLTMLLLNNEYTKYRLHPVYFTDDVLPYHGLWSSAFAGIFMMMPELVGKDSKVLEVSYNGYPRQPTAGNFNIAEWSPDNGIQVSALEYLNDIHFLALSADYSYPSSLVSPWTGTYKTRLVDDLMRRAVIRLLIENPIAALKLYLYVKPTYTVRTFVDVLRDSPNLQWLWLLLLGGLAAILITWFGTALNLSGLGSPKALILTGIAIPFTALPALWAWPSSYSISDLLLVTFVFGQVSMGAIGGFLLHRWQPSKSIGLNAALIGGFVHLC